MTMCMAFQLHCLAAADARVPWAGKVITNGRSALAQKCKPQGLVGVGPGRLHMPSGVGQLVQPDPCRKADPGMACGHDRHPDSAFDRQVLP